MFSQRKYILLFLPVLLLTLTVLVRHADASEISQPQQTDLSAIPRITKTKNLKRGIRLTWSKVPGASRYRVYRKNGGSWKKLSDVKGVAYTDKKVKSGKKYFYTVRCIPSGGIPGSDEKGTAVMFFSPPKLTSAVNKQKGIYVRWKKVSGIDNYRIYRKIGGSGWKAAADVSGSSWTDVDVTSGRKYTYTVQCLSSDKKAAVSSYNTRGVSLMRLTAPVLVSARQSSKETVITWDAVKGAAGYRVLRKTAGSGWKKIGQTRARKFTDRLADRQKEYFYTVRAYKGKSMSTYNTAGIIAAHYDPVQQLLSNTKTARKTDQIVLVIDHKLMLWNKNAKGTWKKAMDVYCGYGSNGLRLAASRREGDRTTPIGSFPLKLAFGLGDDPGTLMRYRKITSNSYWSGVNDSTYNTWVESSVKISGEHLIDYYQYKYAMAIGFNMDPVVIGRGSAIFLHCKSRNHWYTAGCVSVTEKAMLKLMRSVKDGAYMIIVPDESSLADY